MENMNDLKDFTEDEKMEDESNEEVDDDEFEAAFQNYNSSFMQLQQEVTLISEDQVDESIPRSLREEDLSKPPSEGLIDALPRSITRSESEDEDDHDKEEQKQQQKQQANQVDNNNNTENETSQLELLSHDHHAVNYYNVRSERKKQGISIFGCLSECFGMIAGSFKNSQPTTDPYNDEVVSGPRHLTTTASTTTNITLPSSSDTVKTSTSDQHQIQSSNTILKKSDQRQFSSDTIGSSPTTGPTIAFDLTFDPFLTCFGKDRFDEYILSRRIGKGAQSTCLLARLLDQQHVMKRFYNERDFKQEEQALRQLNHPNIIKYKESICFQDEYQDDLRYLVLEYCDRSDLSVMIKKTKSKRISESLFLSIMIQCLEAISFMHSKQFIHRDLKPNNIFVCKDYSIRLGDFGFASRVGDKKALVGGTKIYVPPECAGMKYFDDTKVDIWCIGACAVEMLTAKERDLKLLINKSEICFLEKLWMNEIADGPRLYSAKILNLLGSALMVDPTKRPEAKELLREFVDLEKDLRVTMMQSLCRSKLVI
ncbi:hypothetical protein AKO1_008191 [Acrasis kona]|uniref:Protein kinase domain-containing protein n=1 Tax=Acrasis kona TaxID=1008807 RepID=A0AAW2YK04_9EUKA